MNALEPEVFLRILIGDTADNTINQSLIVRILAILDPSTDHLTEDATEVVMTGIGEETAGVRQHTDEMPQVRTGCEGLDLFFHTFFRIVEPPGRTELNLPGCIRLETAD